MPGFRFRLQVVLDQALREKDARAQAMGEAQRAWQAEIDQLAALERDQEEHRQALIETQNAGKLDVMQIQLGLGWLRTLEGRINQQHGRIGQAAEKLEERRAVLMEAARKVQVLETLRDKARQDYHARLDRQEARFIDELATMRHGRDEGLNSQP